MCLCLVCVAGLLATTLFTFQDHACDNEKLRIRCPHGTTIKIQWAVYGRQVPSSQMCPFAGPMWMPRDMLPSSLSSSSSSSSSSFMASTQQYVHEDTNCQSPISLKVSELVVMTTDELVKHVTY